MTDETVPESHIHGVGKDEGMEFRPKYKYYEDMRDVRRDKEIVLRFRQSPGIKLLLLLGQVQPGNTWPVD